MNSPRNTWYVLGAGAIGCLWAMRLQREGKDVKLLLSERRKQSLNNPDSVSIRYAAAPDARSEVFQFAVGSEQDRIEHLLLATKANDALSAMQSIQQQLSTTASVATLCNGMGYHDLLEKSIRPRALYAITTTDGAYFDHSASIAENDSNGRSFPLLVLAGRGASKITRIAGEQAAESNWRDQLQEMASRLSSKGHKLRPRFNAQRLLLDKLLINACINGLTAIHACCNGGLLDSESARQDLQALIDECVTIAGAAGHKALAAQLPSRVHEVIRATASNYSSTYTDIRNGRTSEIDFINAYLVKLGNSLGTSTARNQAIVDAVARLSP